MLPTYKGMLVKDRIEAQGEPPALGEPVEVYVTVLEPSSVSERRGPAMADALQEIASFPRAFCKM